MERKAVDRNRADVPRLGAMQPRQAVTLECFVKELPFGRNDVLKSVGKPALLLKLRTWRCVCMRSTSLDEGFRAIIRPLLLCGYACWCDKPDRD